jgi:hypothetical protein
MSKRGPLDVSPAPPDPQPNPAPAQRRALPVRYWPQRTGPLNEFLPPSLALIVTRGQPSSLHGQAALVTLPHEGIYVTMAQQPENRTKSS